MQIRSTRNPQGLARCSFHGWDRTQADNFVQDVQIHAYKGAIIYSWYVVMIAHGHIQTQVKIRAGTSPAPLIEPSEFSNVGVELSILATNPAKSDPITKDPGNGFVFSDPTNKVHRIASRTQRLRQFGCFQSGRSDPRHSLQ